jgi:hypothetical protein
VASIDFKLDPGETASIDFRLDPGETVSVDYRYVRNVIDGTGGSRWMVVSID